MILTTLYGREFSWLKRRCSVGGNSVCLNRKFQCDGIVHCDDRSDESALFCSNCTQEMCKLRYPLNSKMIMSNNDQLDPQPHLFPCTNHGQDICLALKFRCDGKVHCDEGSDEAAEQCFNCTDPGLFSCMFRGRQVCQKSQHWCDGRTHCDDNADEVASNCNNCSHSALFRCHVQRKQVCILKSSYCCNGHADCDDASDELLSLCGGEQQQQEEKGEGMAKPWWFAWDKPAFLTPLGLD